MRQDDRFSIAPGLEVRAQGNGECRVATPGGVLFTGPHTLAALGAFVVPRTLAEAVATLEPQLTGPRAAVDLS